MKLGRDSSSRSGNHDNAKESGNVFRIFLLLALSMNGCAADQMDIQERVMRLDDGKQLRYAIALPNELDSDRPVPLILALHYGWQGEVPRYYGKGFLQQMIAPAFAELGAVVLAPDCPDSDWHQPLSERALLSLIDLTMSEYSIDADRIVITGFSLGGMGTWFMAAEHPDLFSAAIPMAAPPIVERPEGPLSSLLETFFDSGEVAVREGVDAVPVYALHGSNDEVIPLAPVQRAIERLKGQGNPIEFVVVEGASHYDLSWYVVPLRVAADWLEEVWRLPEQQ